MAFWGHSCKGQLGLADVLASSLLFHFLAKKTVRKQMAVAADHQHLPAVSRP